MIDTRDNAAYERIAARRRLWADMAMYAVVNGFFIALWAMGGGGFFWPAIILIGWGLHLAICFIEVFARPVTSAQVAAELQRGVTDGGAVR